jgi:MoaA/NifB/PqqE/SkfB family radical SAM enzyme
VAEDLRLDSHKLIFHPGRVADWLDEKRIYPLTVEISPSGACNHRCRFCAFDYLGYQPAFLEEELMAKNLALMAQNGVKAIVMAGEGEPLLNKATPKMIRHIKELGMDAGMSSNGVLFTEKISEECLPYLTWVRFSMNAGTPETYHLVHGGRPEDFNIVVSNLQKAVAVKAENRLPVTLGVQILMLPENVQEITKLGNILKNIGLDYFTVKPYSQHPKSINSAGAAIDYQKELDLQDELDQIADDNFQVYFRAGSMRKLNQCRDYRKCWGLPFWAYIDSQGNVWACLAYIGDWNFCYGNLHQATFTEIWEGEGWTKVMDYAEAMDISDCRKLCRLDEINHYLNRLKQPGRHQNFI